MTDIGAELGRMRKDIERLQRAARLSYASLDDTALEVRDSGGSLRAIVGQQGDGTTAVNVVNGPTPPTPTPPTVTPALAGLTVSWNGSFADSVAAPLDWMRCEIHIGGAADFTPSQSTLRDTIESPQGGMVTIPLPYTEWNVKLRSRTSSGSTSAATTAVAATPRKAATADLTAGIITADLIAVDALNGKTISGGTITGGTITGSTIQTATTGKRIAMLPDGTMALYSGRTGGETPGSLESGITSDGSGMQLGYLVLKPPTHGPTPPEITMAIGPSGEQQWSLGPLGLLAEGSNGYANVFGNLNVTGAISGSASLAVTGAVIKSDETWHTPSFAASWASTGTFNGNAGYQGMRYRYTAEDEVWIYGAAVASAGAGSTVFTLPAKYRPSANIRAIIPANFSSGTGIPAGGWAQITEAGAVAINTGISGWTLAAGTQVWLNGKFPLGTIS
ncbi:hypothetical protein [Streptomyces sp. BE133]|uniref:hypothetical protein n=1 Tax=Streptomyces sp. BE133 TaxID=3002523 RepID=UPI002E788ED1|nr:hypothetical protein [Streptomyces sp. BE133]MEE1812705.1 hypothetical protein [Streptomyces sp. BE133]